MIVLAAAWERHLCRRWHVTMSTTSRKRRKGCGLDMQGKREGIYKWGSTSCSRTLVGLPLHGTKTQQSPNLWACVGQAFEVSRRRLVGHQIGYTNFQVPIGWCRAAIRSYAGLCFALPRRRGHRHGRPRVGLTHLDAHVVAAIFEEDREALLPTSQLPPLHVVVTLVQGLVGGMAGCV